MKQLNCPYAAKCGGCSMSAIPYAEQLAQKQKNMEHLFKGLAVPEPICGAENPYHYRNKVHGVLTRDKSGDIYTGVYEAGSHRVVRVPECLIENSVADRIMADVAALIKSFKYTIYNEKSGYGLLKHILVRVAEETGEYLLILVAASPILPSKNNFVKAVRKLHPEITSIVLNVNDKDTTMVLGTRDIVLFGPGFIKDRLMGLTFRLSPQSFYQINHAQTAVLYEKAIEYAHLTGKETVLDTYCGIGTIGMLASGKAKEVIGVELNRDAVKDAALGAKNNGIKNARFVQGDATEFMLNYEGKVDVVFMDPPRSGSTERFMDAVIRLKPSRIVYISCGPDTQVRDLKYLLGKSDYRIEHLCPVDLFPLTEHVETVCLMSRKDN